MSVPPRRAIDAEIARVAIPAALALATDPLYDLCDTAILGHIGTAQLAGAALAARILAFGYAVFVFLMFGTTAAVARHHGAGHDRASAEQGITAAWLAVVLGVGAAAVFAVGGRTFIGWMGGTGAVARFAWTYLWVSLAGMPAFTLVMVGVGFRRGHNDTRTPLAITAITVTLNLVLEIVAVYGLGFGVGASALGTVIAKWVGAAIYLVLIGRAARGVGATWTPRRVHVRSQLVVGRDLVVRTALLLGVFSVAQAAAARSGVHELAAYAIAFELWLLGAYAIDGIEAAGQSLVAHRIGAGRLDELVAVARRLRWWGLMVGLGVGVLLAATSQVSPRIFTDDAAVVASASMSVLWVAVTQPIGGLAFALDGILVGASRQRYLAGAMAVAALVFGIALAVAGAFDWGLAGIWAALAAFMIARATTGWRGAGQLQLV